MFYNYLFNNYLSSRVSALTLSLAAHFTVVAGLIGLGFASEDAVPKTNEDSRVFLVSYVSITKHQADPAPRLGSSSPEQELPQLIKEEPKVEERKIVERVTENKRPTPQQQPQRSSTKIVSRSAAEGVPGVGVSATGVADSHGVSGSEAGASYERLVVAHLNRVKRYPERARSRRLEGTAYLKLELDRNGSLKRSEVITSSSYRVLDDEVLRMAKVAAPFPAVPANYVTASPTRNTGDSSVEFLVPIEFKIG